MTGKVPLVLCFILLWVQIQSHGIQRRSDDPNQLEVLVQQQAQALQEMKAELTALKNEVQANKQQQTKAVAFTARFSSFDVKVAPKGVFRFDVVPINTGNGYSTHSGIFTAPSSGTYVFLVNIEVANNNNYIQAAIDKSGTTLAVVHADSTNDLWDKATTHVTVHMNAGEEVWVRHNAGGVEIYGQWWTTFTGFLIHAD